MAPPSPSPLRQRLLEQMLEVAKLPARTVRYLELQRILARAQERTLDDDDVHHCDADVECDATVVLRRGQHMPRLVRWGWTP